MTVHANDVSIRQFPVFMAKASTHRGASHLHSPTTYLEVEAESSCILGKADNVICGTVTW